MFKNPSLEDYDKFASSIGFKLTKDKNGVLIYKCEETELRPFELGEIYRLCRAQYSKGIEDSLGYLKSYIEKAKTKEELIKGINEFISEMKNIIECEK